MKKTYTLFLLLISILGFSQFTTGSVSLTANRTITIDTNATMVTLTITGPNTTWLGIGFGGGSMSSVTDMFIWSASANRDYTPSGGLSSPSADPAGSQSWTITSDTVSGTTRTVVATRSLVSAGDYTFLNNNSPIDIIYAQGGTSTNLGYHSSNPHSAATLQRTALGVEDFSLNASSIYPNPSNGTFNVSAKTALSEINIYSQVGALVKTIKVDKTDATEVSVAGLQTGVYLIELKNDSEKSWKKVVVE